MIPGTFWYSWTAYGIQSLSVAPVLKDLLTRCAALSMHRPVRPTLRALAGKKLLLGYAFAIMAAVFASLTHSLSKPLLENTDPGMAMNPLVLAVFVYVVAGLFFTPLKKSGRSVRTMGGRNLILISLIGVAEVIAMIVSFFGITETTAVNASIFINAEIIFSISIAAIIFRERLKPNEMMPFGLILVGVVALPIGHDFYQNGMVFTKLVFGDMMIILGGLFFSISNILAKYVSHNIDAKRITQVSSFVAAGFGLAVVLNSGMPFEFSLSQMPAILAIGVLDVGFATLFFIIALRAIGAIKSVLIFSTATIFGMIFANLLLGESVTVLNVMSIITVFAGLYWLRNRFAGEE